MARLVVEGETLGQIHRNYNKILNETTLEVISDINYDEPDLENLLKIDIACRKRNVEYILRVLQCEDILYVSRAIKRSTWLVTDPQYADIINPKYLNQQLSPKMMSNAYNKLLLHVRVNLKDEKRVEEFFKYYEKRDLKAAFKWLLNCSNEFTEQIVQRHAETIPLKLIERLCRKSVRCVDLYLYSGETHDKRKIISANIIKIFKTKLTKYLDIVETLRPYEVPHFGPRATKLLMQAYSERVMGNIDNYAEHIHVPTFARFVKRDQLKDFITRNFKNRRMRDWFTYVTVKPFLCGIPIESRFEFIKECFICRNQEDVAENILWNDVMYRMYIINWYSHAPFDSAFIDLKELVTSESDAKEKGAMLRALVKCAGDNMSNIHTLLKYFHENHINENFYFKSQFGYDVIRFAKTHRFDQEAWGYLNDLFVSIDIYNQFSRPPCDEGYDPYVMYPHDIRNYRRPTYEQDIFRAIILYHVIRDESVPDVIEKKFQFDTFKYNRNKLSEEEQDKVFMYLFNYLMVRIDTTNINEYVDYREALDVLKNFLKLLVDWNKDLKNFPTILHTIREMIQIYLRTKWMNEILTVYNYKKSWRKLLFAESIILNPSHEVCTNALKHDPTLLETYRSDVEVLWLNDDDKFNTFFRKVRTYFSHSLAGSYRNFFINKINQTNTQKAAVIGLIILLPKVDLLNLLHKYVPNECKFVGNKHANGDQTTNLSKHILSIVHRARPQPSPALIVSYAAGHYLQYVLPSFNSIIFNVSDIQARECLTQLLKAPISLQKHGVRIAFAKLQIEELKELFTDISKISKNSNIRRTIFNKTFDLLCKQTESSAITDVWELLSALIDSLRCKENTRIYSRLKKIEKVPKSVRAEFWMKSYQYLMSSSAKSDCEELLISLIDINDLMEYIDEDIIVGTFLQLFDEEFIKGEYKFLNVFVEFVLSTKTEEAHVVRYNKVFVPILERSFGMWNKSYEDIQYYYVRDTLKSILSTLNKCFDKVVLQKQMIVPTYMYADILERLREFLSNSDKEEHYVMITTQILSLDCVQILDKLLKANKESSLLESLKRRNVDYFKQLYTAAAVELGEVSVSHLKEQVSRNFQFTYIQFAQAFNNAFDQFNFDSMNKINALKVFLKHKDFIPGCLLVLKTLPKHGFTNEETKLRLELLKELSEHSSEEVRTQADNCNKFWYL